MQHELGTAVKSDTTADGSGEWFKPARKVNAIIRVSMSHKFRRGLATFASELSYSSLLLDSCLHFSPSPPVTAVISFFFYGQLRDDPLSFESRGEEGRKSDETFVRFARTEKTARRSAWWRRRRSIWRPKLCLALVLSFTTPLSRSPILSLALSLSLSFSLSSLSNAQTELACTRLPREVRLFPRRPDQSEPLRNVDLRR